MKKQSLILFTLLLSAIITYAQELKPNAIIKTNTATYITTGLHDGAMSVVNSKSNYHNKIPRNRNPDMTFELKDKSALLNAFTHVFSDERLKQLIPEKRMIMTFYVNPSGQVIEVSFIFNKNTAVTALELEDLEKAIKANVFIKIRPEEYKGQDFFDVGFIVVYSKVLDRTLK